MTDKTDSKERDLMALVDAYAEARHIGGCHTYNAKTAEARAKVVASLAANAGSEPVASPPLQHFESPRAKILMRAWQEGWDACRDAEYVGEDAQNDAFNQSSTVNHCVAEDMLYTHPSPPEGMVGGWIAEKEPPCKD